MSSTTTCSVQLDLEAQIILVSIVAIMSTKFFRCWLVQAEVVLVLVWSIQGQQTYVNNRQLDCYNQRYDNITRGFDCNGLNSSCQAYLTFRSNPPYNTPVYIDYLIKTSKPNLIASINNIANVTATLPTDTPVLIPVNCSCSGRGDGGYYQFNTTYTIQNHQETYFTVANNTYQGLTTCQAMMSQNSVGDRNLTLRLELLVPLRCACPTPDQKASGFNYLLTYMVTWGDSISAIAHLFNVDQQSLLEANKLSQDDIIFPFTPILVPLKTAPTKIQLPVPSPPPSSPHTPLTPPSHSSTSSKKWVFVGAATGAVLLLLVAILFAFLFCFYRRRRNPTPVPTPGRVRPPKTLLDSADYSLFPQDSNSLAQPQGFRSAVESLTLYKFQDLQIATGSFSEENRIQGSVYRGSFNGDDAAIKVMKGDVSSEINILKKINHSNIIRLSGFCVHEGNTYLVYEFADKGALSDWLHSNKYQTSDNLTWKQRVQIAYDVANALNYLHKYTNPPYIHKNLKTSNILLDTDLRAKITNFGLARSAEGDEHEQGGYGLQLTRHVVGTYGYMAPEYIENGVITPKLDVFAFGVVVLELLSGREAVTGDKNGGEELLYASISRVLEESNVREKLRGFIDPSLRNEYPLDLAFSMAQLAKNCTAHDLNARPSISEVFITLSKILSSLSDWDPSDELNNSRSLSRGR